MPQARNVLRRVRAKKTVKVDFKTPLGRYIRRVYGDNAAVEAQDSLDEIQELRAQMASFCTLRPALPRATLRPTGAHIACQCICERRRLSYVDASI
jgi:hypothetical protein